jgi:DNA-binding NtrC family response regulator
VFIGYRKNGGISIMTITKKYDTLHHSLLSAGIITQNREMQRIFQYIKAIASSPKPVLITGESGTGKELIARIIYQTENSGGDFISVNISGLDDTIISDTLFGHVHGAFTGSKGKREGLIQKASRGVLFLDEIGDLSLQSQVKLLRLLQDGTYYILGADNVTLSRARIITATNVNLQQQVKLKKFRDDLYFRLITHHIHLPPLRNRREDIPLLVNYFVNKAARSLDKEKPVVPHKLYVLLSRYTFPGNIRELEGMIFNAVSMNTSSQLSIYYFCDHITRYISSIPGKTRPGIVNMKINKSNYPKPQHMNN